jgi:hypothetical protein
MRFLARFAQQCFNMLQLGYRSQQLARGENHGCSVVPRCRTSERCTNFGQAPVDGLHSIENRRDRVARISLTSPAGGVKHTRSLTTFLVLQSWWQADSNAPAMELSATVETSGERATLTPTAAASIRGASAGYRRRAGNESKARRNPETSSGPAADCESGNSRAARRYASIRLASSNENCDCDSAAEKGHSQTISGFPLFVRPRFFSRRLPRR